MGSGAAGADASDEGKDQVLGGHPRRRCPLELQCEGLRAALQEALRRQHVAHLARADPEGESAQRTVGAGVAVPADDGQAGAGEPELGADDVHDSLPCIARREERDPELLAVALERPDLIGRGSDRQRATAVRTAPRGYGVVHRRERPLGPPDAEASSPQPGKGLRRRDLVDEVKVDVEDARRLLRLGRDEVCIPELVEERARA